MDTWVSIGRRASTPAPTPPPDLRGEEMEHRFDHENLDVYRLALEVARWIPSVTLPRSHAKTRLAGELRALAAKPGEISVLGPRVREGGERELWLLQASTVLWVLQIKPVCVYSFGSFGDLACEGGLSHLSRPEKGHNGGILQQATHGGCVDGSKNHSSFLPRNLGLLLRYFKVV